MPYKNFGPLICCASNGVMAALKEIGYQGYLTLEADLYEGA